MRPYDRPLQLAKRKSWHSLPEYSSSEFNNSMAMTTYNYDSGKTYASTAIVSGATLTSTPVASSSGQASSPASSSSDGLDTAEKILLCLLGGKGVSWYDQRHLIEECNSCKRFYLSNYLRSHIKECSKDDTAPMADEDDENYFLCFRSQSVEV